MAQDFIGGSGFTVKYLYDEVPADCDPLGPENKLIYAPGPFTGTTIPCASRMAINAKSPATGAMGVATTGGHFPVEMKRAGYDVLIIEGKAEEPTYLWIKNGEVKFRSAKEIWGLPSTDTQLVIKDELHDQNVRISCIGPAGEKLSKMACIVNERRVAGRKGLGAVMGSKNLKAIALRGDEQMQIADKEKYDAARKRMRDGMQKSPILYPGVLPLRHLDHSRPHPGSGHLPGQELDRHRGLHCRPTRSAGTPSRAVSAGKTACAGCPVGCSQMRLAKEAPYAGMFTEGPEYETLYSFGGVTGRGQSRRHHRRRPHLRRAGPRHHVGGRHHRLRHGAVREGHPHPGGHGRPRSALRQRPGHDQAAPHDRRAPGSRRHPRRRHQGCGRDASARGPRSTPCTSRAWSCRRTTCAGPRPTVSALATAFTGADHNKGYAFQEIFGIPIPYPVDRFAIEGKGKLTKWNQDARTALADSPTMCVFLMDMAVADFMFENTADLMEGTTGLIYTPEEVHQVGERINNLARVFNILAGFTRADDDLPERLKTEPIPEGPSKGELISQADLDFMLDEYYDARGWTRDGVPTRAKLEELRLGYAGRSPGSLVGRCVYPGGGRTRRSR